MATQIQACFERYEKKYMLTVPQQQFLLKEMAPHMVRDPVRRIHHLQHLL